MATSTPDLAGPVRDFIDDWPYTPQYLQKTLDPELISAHGMAILRRCLNNSRMVCFVGSGVSMAYGRAGWGTMVRRLTRPEPLAEGATGISAHLVELLRDLNLEGRSPDDELQSGRYPAAFQFSEQIEELGSAKGTARRGTLRKRAMRLLHDDRGHAALLLEAMLRDLEKLGTGTPHDPQHAVTLAEEMVKLPPAEDLKRTSGTASDGAWRERLALDATTLRKLRESLAAKAPAARAAAELLAAVAQALPGCEPLPLRRFVVPALYRLVHDRQDFRAGHADGWPGDPSPTQASPLRSRLIPERRDPLLILSRDLHISRFITTNYDLDIERLLRDRGFETEGPPDPGGDGGASAAGRNPRHTVGVNALGTKTRDSLFHPGHAVELIDFAVQTGSHACQVVHLHGRATHGDDMIITESDYLRQYLQRGEEAEIVNDAIALAFGANPVLFVGSGMSEDDILRPLRQFVAERKSRVDRSSIVLLPAAGSRARQIEEVIALYSRYGVHTVHYGVGRDDDGEPVRWLAHLLLVIRSLKVVLRTVESFLCGKKTPQQLHDEVQRGVESFVSDAEFGERRPFERWKRLLEPPVGRWPTLRLPARIETESAASTAEARIEMALLNASLHFVCDVVLAASNLDVARRVLGDEQACPDTFLQERRGLGLLDKQAIDGGTTLRVVLAHLALLDGLPDALLGLSLCAKLNGLHEDWQGWQRRRQQLPAPRWPAEERLTMQFEVADGAGDIERGRRLHWPVPVIARHPIALREPPGGPRRESRAGYPVPATDRFFSEAPSQTIRTLYRALIKERANPGSSLHRPCAGVGRRIFLFIAPRGVGKGHFFEAMRTRRRLGEFVRLSWPNGQRCPDGSDVCSYAGFAFFNLSFSLEVVSVVDRLTALLVERARDVFPRVPGNPGSPAETIREAAGTMNDNRIGCLAAVLRLYARHAERAMSRVLVAFNGFNVLFDERGNPKNAELHRVVTTLLSPHNDRAPIDYFLVCSETCFPAILTRGDGPPTPLNNAALDGWSKTPRIAFEHLVREDVSEKGLRRLDTLVERLHVNIAPAPPAWRPASPRQGCNFVHVLREARTSNTVAKYFPEIALSVACHPGYLSETGAFAEGPVEIEIGDPSALSWIQSAIIARSQSLTDAEPMIEHIPLALRQLAHEITGRGEGRVPTFGAPQDRPLVDRCFALPTARPPADAELTRAARKVDRDFTRLSRTLGRNRYLVTLACAGVSELAWTPAAPARLRTLHVVEWFAALGAQLANAPAQSREDAIISRVFDLYQGRHEHGCGLPGACAPHLWSSRRRSALRLGAGPSRASRNTFETFRGPAGWALQLRLLWHLAVVGHPVEADVLATAPMVQKDCLRILGVEADDAPPHTLHDCYLALVQVALDALVHRCLVFRLAPPFGDDGGGEQTAFTLERRQAWWEAQRADDPALPPLADQGSREFLSEGSGWRFSVHSFIQRAIFRQLHAPFVEFPHVDQFGLSMWATQPDDLPRLNRSAARAIAELIADWTGAPQDVKRITRVSAYHHALVRAETPLDPARPGQPADPELLRRTLPARMLRAAYGVVRSAYSVGVVSRFHDFEDGSTQDAPDEGYFEQHRLQIRWLLERAVDLGRGDPQPQDAPFHAEEIVWLYNECGLFCLVEGRLDAAAGLFHVALRAAERIEAHGEHGALWCRIHLNLAIVDIERGRIRDARRNLEAIRAVEDENPILRILAHGFLGLVEHLSGNLDMAQKVYTGVIEDLHQFGQSRAIAIFSRHLAELHRVRGPSDANEATRVIERAIAAATKGGHEDVRQLALLSRVRLAIGDPERQKFTDIQSNLDAIERYGVEMGMPRLIADTAFARAEHLLQLGETRHAAKLARKCLEIATANNLRLRQMTALALLAKIYQHRGMLVAAEPLLARAAELADLCDYSNARETTLRRGAPA